LGGGDVVAVLSHLRSSSPLTAVVALSCLRQWDMEMGNLWDGGREQSAEEV